MPWWVTKSAEVMVISWYSTTLNGNFRERVAIGEEEERRTARRGSKMYALPMREHKHGETQQGEGTLQYQG